MLIASRLWVLIKALLKGWDGLYGLYLGLGEVNVGSAVEVYSVALGVLVGPG